MYMLLLNSDLDFLVNTKKAIKHPTFDDSNCCILPVGITFGPFSHKLVVIAPERLAIPTIQVHTAITSVHLPTNSGFPAILTAGGGPSSSGYGS